MPTTGESPLQRLSEEEFRILVDAVEDYAIHLLDLSGHIVTWNQGAQRIKGYASAEAMGRHFSLFFPPEDVAAGVPARILDLVALEGCYRGEGWRIRKDGSRFWASVVLSTLRDSSGKPIGYAKVTRDLSERKRQEGVLRASQRALQVQRDRLEITLLSIADGVITTDASGAVEMMNPASESMTGWPLSQACEQLASLLRDVVTLDFRWEERLFRISLSVGMARITPHPELSGVMKQADVACYAAKQGGRNRISLYEPGGGEGHDRHRQIEVVADIQEAIETNRFSLHVQKIVSLQTGACTRHEVLLRMLDRNGGVIMPAQFIPAAERYDQMGQLDRWVLQKVLGDYGPRLAKQSGVRLNVNVSANSPNDSGFLDFLLGWLGRSALAPEAITLEITETSLINNLFTASHIVEEARAAGCSVALDDFGAGLCSFNYLRNFKVDFIKIEGSFIRNMRRSSVDLAIVKSLNNIAHEVHSRTIAEFVEDADLLEIARKLGIDFAQGYAVGRPVPIETLSS